MTYEPQCNGICIRGYEILEDGGSGVAYAHPDCELHGNPPREEPDDYDEPCQEIVEIGEDDEWDRESDLNGYGVCGGKVVSTGGQHHYNGHYDCYTMYLHCDRCGDYEVECV